MHWVRLKIQSQRSEGFTRVLLWSKKLFLFKRTRVNRSEYSDQVSGRNSCSCGLWQIGCSSYCCHMSYRSSAIEYRFSWPSCLRMIVVSGFLYPMVWTTGLADNTFKTAHKLSDRCNTEFFWEFIWDLCHVSHVCIASYVVREMTRFAGKKLQITMVHGGP